MLKKYSFKIFIIALSIFVTACTSPLTGEKIFELLNGDKKDIQQVEKIISEVYLKTFHKDCKEDCSQKILNEVVLGYLTKFKDKRTQDGRELIQRAIEDDNGDLFRHKKENQAEQDRILRESVKNLEDRKNQIEKQKLPLFLKDD